MTPPGRPPRVTTPDPEDTALPAGSPGGAPARTRPRSPQHPAARTPLPHRHQPRYPGAAKAIAACTGTGYLAAMPLTGAGWLATWAAVTAVLLACCAVVAVRGAPPPEQMQHDEGNSP